MLTGMFHLINDNVNASDGYDKFSSIHIDIFNNCFPERIPKMLHRLTPRREWMTKGLMKSCKKKSKLYKKACKSQNEVLNKKYIAYRNKI